MRKTEVSISVLILAFILSFTNPGFSSTFSILIGTILYGFIVFTERHSESEIKELKNKIAEIENKITVIQIGKMGR